MAGPTKCVLSLLQHVISEGKYGGQSCCAISSGLSIPSSWIQFYWKKTTSCKLLLIGVFGIGYIIIVIIIFVAAVLLLLL